MVQGDIRHWRRYLGGSLLFASLYLHYGQITPFLPVWYSHRGLTPERIAGLLSIPVFLRVLILAPVMAIADRLRRVRDFIWIATLLAAILLVSMHYLRDFRALVLATALFAIFWDPIQVLADAYTVGNAQDRGLDFGRMRVWASSAYAVASIAAGWLLRRVHAEDIILLGAVTLLAPLCVVPFLPSDRSFKGARKAVRGEWRQLVTDRALLLMVVAASFVQASHALLNNFASIEWLQQGMSETTVGELWATGIISEAALLWIGRRALGDRSPAVLLLFGAAGSILRWVFMARMPAGLPLFLVQLLNGPSIMAPILAIMLFIERRIAPHLIASAQGIYALSLNACMAAAMLGCGPLWHSLYVNAYLVMAAVAMVGGIIGMAALRASAPVKPCVHRVGLNGPERRIDGEV